MRQLKAALAPLFLTLILIAPAGKLASPVVAAQCDCGQPITSGGSPTATDCLAILRIAVGLSSCSPCPAEACAPGGSLPTTATDALACLRAATGTAGHLNCPNQVTTTSSTTTTTSPVGSLCDDLSGQWAVQYEEECTPDSTDCCFDAQGVITVTHVGDSFSFDRGDVVWTGTLTGSSVTFPVPICYDDYGYPTCDTSITMTINATCTGLSGFTEWNWGGPYQCFGTNTITGTRVLQ